MSKSIIKTTTLASAAALAASLSFANTSSANSPLFNAVDLPQGYMAMVGEGRCGADKDKKKDREGRCGYDKDDEKDEDEDDEKDGEGRCGSA